MRTFFAIIVFLIIIIGIVLLQIFFSKKQNKWLGFILPIIFFLFSLIGVLGIPMYSTFTLSEQTVMENGEIVNNVVSSQTNKADMASVIVSMVYIFILLNIPTVILMAIYFACREKIKNNKEIDKMNIQDLE